MSRKAFFALALAAAAFGAWGQQGITWLDDVDEAFAVAAKTYQLLVIEVSDDRGRREDGVQWRKAQKDKGVLEALKPYLCVRLDADKGGRTAEFLASYHLGGFPSLLFVDCKGGEVNNMPIIDAFYGPELAKTVAEQLDFYADQNGAVREDWIDTDVRWLGDIDEALRQAKKLDRKIYVYFVLNYCHAVVDMNRDTFALKRISDYLNENFVCLKMDYFKVQEEGRLKDFFADYDLGAAPTNIFLDKGGRKLAFDVGYLGPKEFKKMADRVLNK
jgi:thioredoxin-related protein